MGLLVPGQGRAAGRFSCVRLVQLRSVAFGRVRSRSVGSVTFGRVRLGSVGLVGVGRVQPVFGHGWVARRFRNDTSMLFFEIKNGEIGNRTPDFFLNLYSTNP